MASDAYTYAQGLLQALAEKHRHEVAGDPGLKAQEATAWAILALCDRVQQLDDLLRARGSQ
jgi:hypothetical protein